MGVVAVWLEALEVEVGHVVVGAVCVERKVTVGVVMVRVDVVGVVMEMEVEEG